MKYIALLAISLLVVSCSDKKHNLRESIHITVQGDTVRTYGGKLTHDPILNNWELHRAQ